MSKHHSIKYNYTLIVDNRETIHFGPYSQPNVPIKDSIEENKSYSLTIVLWTEPGNGKFITTTVNFSTCKYNPNIMIHNH